MMKRRRWQPRRREEKNFDNWIPKTKVGKLVKSGEITNIEEIYQRNLPILEPEIVDMLIPTLEDEVLKLKMVQRVTDSGRKGSFMVTVAVGNKNSYIGVGTAKGQEPRPTIEKAITNAKKNLVHIRRGCGSWECGCGEDHSLPFKVKGSRGSVDIELVPAPKGTGIVAGKVAKKVLELAGIKDVWSYSSGQTCTVFNSAFATFNALKQTRSIKFKEKNK